MYHFFQYELFQAYDHLFVMFARKHLNINIISLNIVVYIPERNRFNVRNVLNVLVIRVHLVNI